MIDAGTEFGPGTAYGKQRVKRSTKLITLLLDFYYFEASLTVT